MAGDTEDLVLSISADVRQMQRALARLTGDTAKTTKAIQQHFDKLGDVGGAAFDRVAANSNRAGAVVAGNAKKIATAMNASRLQTANLAAQLNDIGVQLASGASPFQIALQQGTQINQLLGAGGVRGAVSLLGGAFASLVNPVSLATIAIIGLGGAAVQYFSGLLSDGEKSEETLKKQAELVKRVADRWGDAIPAIREYANEQDRLAQSADISEATGLVRADIWKNVRQQIADARLELVDLVTLIPRTAESQDQIVAVQRAFEDLDQAIAGGKATTEDLDRVQAALASLFASTGIPVVNDLAARFRELAGAIGEAADRSAGLDVLRGVEQTLSRINEANAEFIAAEERKQGLSAAQLRLENEIARVRKDAERAGGFLTEDEARAIATGNIAADDRRGEEARLARRSTRLGLSDVERQRKAVKDLIEQLEFEQQQLGRTDEQRRVAIELRKAGAAATDEERARIEELVIATDRQREAMKQAGEASKFFGDLMEDALLGIIPKIETGNAALDKLLNTLIEVAAQALLFGKGPLAGLFGGGGLFGGKGGLLGGFLIPGILHSGGVAGQDGYGHGRKVSPGVFAGAHRYHSGGIAGLRPGEVPAILQRGEIVLPRGGRVSSASQQVVINAPINAPGADPAQLRRVEQSVRELGRNVPKIAVAAMQTTTTRNVRPGG